MALWIELSMEFERAFLASNDDLIKRVLSYAAWSISDKSGKLPTEASTAAVCAFYESLPQNKKFWPFFRKWFPPAEFKRIAPFFSYHASADELDQIHELYQQA
ncbi:hypothetical protein [Marinobacter arenosus]|uniref:hypothetical protein n=1 Tax=Marinobacter arenosus TaxID=2856822 RepID=UPI001C4B6CE8|nr:hypothetical protein [Marinobacter arenosus]MBW0149036.1 hypothetical protein [Marinobacter arenosus]